MASRRRVKVKANPNKLLMAVVSRVELPALPINVSYQPDVDTLYLRFSEDEVTHSEDDMDRGLVFDYHGRKMVGIEILNASED
jgi:uncharacterized protein YuzE